MENEELDFAFNLGSHYRTEGKPISSNPYPPGIGGTAFERGGVDATLHWGEWVEGRWEVRPLPTVRYA